jgi:PIN domain nuclease of toxin-antitoxin system
VSGQVLADTHALIWYLFADERLSSEARSAFHGAIAAGFPILVSAISIIEIIYLEEKHRIPVGAAERIRRACEVEKPSIEVVAIDSDLAHGIRQIARAHVPDMPDRIIAATAVALGVTLVTRDAKIVASGVETIRA